MSPFNTDDDTLPPPEGYRPEDFPPDPNPPTEKSSLLFDDEEGGSLDGEGEIDPDDVAMELVEAEGGKELKRKTPEHDEDYRLDDEVEEEEEKEEEKERKKKRKVEDESGTGKERVGGDATVKDTNSAQPNAEAEDAAKGKPREGLIIRRGYAVHPIPCECCANAYYFQDGRDDAVQQPCYVKPLKKGRKNQRSGACFVCAKRKQGCTFAQDGGQSEDEEEEGPASVHGEGTGEINDGAKASAGGGKGTKAGHQAGDSRQDDSGVKAPTKKKARQRVKSAPTVESDEGPVDVEMEQEQSELVPTKSAAGEAVVAESSRRGKAEGVTTRQKKKANEVHKGQEGSADKGNDNGKKQARTTNSTPLCLTNAAIGRF